MKITTQKWDPSEYLDSPEMIHDYLKAVMAEGDTRDLIAALGDVAKAKGMTEIAQKAGLNRQSLYRALSPTGSPQFDTIVKVLRAFDFKLTVEPANDKVPAG